MGRWETDPEGWARKALANAQRRATDYGHDIEGFQLHHAEDLIAEYGDTCATCEAGSFETYGHIVSIRNGGAHGPGNGLPQCLKCNQQWSGTDVPPWAIRAKAGTEVQAPEVSPSDILEAAERAVTWTRTYSAADETDAWLAVLWSVATWLHGHVRYMPRLLVESLSHGVGKTQFTEVPAMCAYNVKRHDTGAPSGALVRRQLIPGFATFRVDELDKLDGPLWKIFNAGFKHGAEEPFLDNTDGAWEEVNVPIWSAMVVGGINTKMPRDARSRTLTVKLMRDPEPRSIANAVERDAELESIGEVFQAWGASLPPTAERNYWPGEVFDRLGNETGLHGEVQRTYDILPAIILAGESLGGDWTERAYAVAKRELGKAAEGLDYVPLNARAIYILGQWFVDHPNEDQFVSLQAVKYIGDMDADHFGAESPAGAINLNRLGGYANEWGCPATKGLRRVARWSIYHGTSILSTRPRSFKREPVLEALAKVEKTYPSLRDENEDEESLLPIPAGQGGWTGWTGWTRGATSQ